MPVQVTVTFDPNDTETPVSVSPDPIYLFTKKEPTKAEWHLQTKEKGAKITGIVFDKATPSGQSLDHTAGPFSDLKASDGTGAKWDGACAADAETGEYKYTVKLKDAYGKPIDLDPKVVVDVPGGG